MIETLQSPSAAERLRAAEAFVTRYPADAEVLIIGASRDAADDLARRVTAARGATFGLHRASFLQLAVRFAAAEMARLALAPATALGANAVAARISFEAVRERALAYFTPVARYPGFARALAATLAELRVAGVDPGALETLDGPGHDVAELARRFEAQLDAGRIADRAGLLGIAARAAAAGALDSLKRMPMVLLDVAIAGQAERDFVHALSAIAPPVLATVPAGDGATLEALGAGASSAAAAQAEPESSDLAQARAFLFAAAPPPRPAVRGDVLFFSAPGQGPEMVEIARRILAEARAGASFAEMAGLFPAPG